MPDSTPTITSRLKAATDDLHRRAESRPLQRLLVKGTLPQTLYVAYLSHLYLVHRALEDRLRRARDLHPAFAAVVIEHHFREGHLRTDLDFFEVTVSQVTGLSSTRALVEAIDDVADTQPVALLGMLYVLEGSTNGSTFIARAAGRAYGLRDAGRRYLDPHGELQRSRWLAFKRDLDAVALPERQATAIIDAANVMFEGFIALSDELMAPAAVGR